MYEARIQPQRDVVQKEALADRADVDPPLSALEGCEGSERVLSVDAEVSGEVVPSPERNADERKVALEGDCDDGGERSVSTRHSQGFGSGLGRSAGNLRRVVVLGEDVDVHTKATSFVGELFRRGPLVSRPRIDQEEA